MLIARYLSQVGHQRNLLSYKLFW